MLTIEYEDEVLLVVNKPPGVLSQPGKHVDVSIATQVADAYPDATGPMLVHRLDMDTSGLLLLAKNRHVHRHLQQQFEKRVISKRYVALLEHPVEGIGGRIMLPLRLDIDNRPSQIVCHTHGKACDTLWQQDNADCRRIVLTPVTGRTHQLRVHCAHGSGLANPIAGDRLYGTEGGRLMLHAQSLGFNHPLTGQRLLVHSAAPF